MAVCLLTTTGQETAFVAFFFSFSAKRARLTMVAFNFIFAVDNFLFIIV